MNPIATLQEVVCQFALLTTETAAANLLQLNTVAYPPGPLFGIGGINMENEKRVAQIWMNVRVIEYELRLSLFIRNKKLPISYQTIQR